MARKSDNQDYDYVIVQIEIMFENEEFFLLNFLKLK
jgi:hypothetical protein